MFSTKNPKKHKLVAIGDSMAQGFKNGGIYRTDLSFPAVIARSFGDEFTFEAPSFSAQTGIPVNMELLIRGLQEEFGDRLRKRDFIRSAAYVYTTLRRIKNYWEGNFKPLNVERELPYHNQAVWGFSNSDVWLMNESYSKNFIKNNPPGYTVFNVLPDHAMHITSRMVLNPSFEEEFAENSMIDNAKLLSEDGGIENLICCVGHNNIVGAVTKLQLIYSEKEDVCTYHGERKCTVFRPEHFETETRNLYERISQINAQNVFVPTIPYMTIPPAIRGVNEDRTLPESGYFDYYSRFWIWDEDFNPDKHPHLTREDAITLDQHVDQYNTTIRDLAHEFGFNVVPIHRYVREAARRRHGSEKLNPFPDEFIQAIRANPKTTHLIDNEGEIRLSTDYLRLDENTGKLDRGGIFSLDGLHPTTIGYGLIGNIYMQVMKKAGVKFEKPFDWNYVINNDTLITEPPLLLDNLRLTLRLLAMGRGERFTMLGKNMLQQLLELFSTGPAK